MWLTVLPTARHSEFHKQDAATGRLLRSVGTCTAAVTATMRKLSAAGSKPPAQQVVHSPISSEVRAADCSSTTTRSSTCLADSTQLQNTSAAVSRITRPSPRQLRSDPHQAAARHHTVSSTSATQGCDHRQRVQRQYRSCQPRSFQVKPSTRLSERASLNWLWSASLHRSEAVSNQCELTSRARPPPSESAAAQCQTAARKAARAAVPIRHAQALLPPFPTVSGRSAVGRCAVADVCGAGLVG
jgi:hypothetical protein